MFVAMIINPGRLREGYGACMYMYLFCMFVTTLPATYFVYKSKVRCYKVLYGVPNACFVWISLKMLCSPVLASFADAKLLDFPQVTAA